MFSKSKLTWCVLLAVVVWTPGAQGNFILWDDEETTVNSTHQEGNLYDESRAFIVSGGEVSYLYAHNYSTVDMSGGSISIWLEAHDSSTVYMSGGEANYLYSYDSSTVNMSGGSVVSFRAYNYSTVDITEVLAIGVLHAHNYSTVYMSGGSIGYDLFAYESSTVNMSGGSVIGNLSAQNFSKVNISGGSVGHDLRAYDSSIIDLYVKDFRLGSGLTLVGNRILGMGILSGEWMGDTERWTINIADNYGAGIFISLVGAGDANCDGVVDEADAAVLAANWLTPAAATWREGDFNDDGAVDDADAALLAINWQQSAGVATIPEPAAPAMLATVLVGLLAVNRRRQQR